MATCNHYWTQDAGDPMTASDQNRTFVEAKAKTTGARSRVYFTEDGLGDGVVFFSTACPLSDVIMQDPVDSASFGQLSFWGHLLASTTPGYSDQYFWIMAWDSPNTSWYVDVFRVGAIATSEGDSSNVGKTAIVYGIGE